MAVLSGRPAPVKAVHEIEIAEHSPIAARSDQRFSGYFHSLCSELDVQTHARVGRSRPVLNSQ